MTKLEIATQLLAGLLSNPNLVTREIVENETAGQGSDALDLEGYALNMADAMLIETEDDETE